ncbi:MAG: sensor histidine kinase [Dehalococcoidia bacterium]
MELQVIRVVQEALTNVRKHSGSTSAWVAVALDDSDVLITIGDRGKGFDPRIVESNEQAFGVRTMRERIERAGGRLTIESRPGVGTQVKIRVAPGDGGYHDQDSNTSGRRSAPVS